MLGYRGRSRSELKGRLAMKGFPPKEVEAALGRLAEAGLMDDSALAGSLVRTAREVKFLGAAGAMRLLLQRGIQRVEAEAAVEGYEEAEGAQRLVQRKLQRWQGITPLQARKRLYSLLRRRGFSAGTIGRVLKKTDF